MASMFDMTLIGGKELERKLARLSDKVQVKVIRPGFRKSMVRIQNEILINLSGRVVREQTGRWVAAMERRKPSTRFSKKEGKLVTSVPMPDPAELGITNTKEEGYYPGVVEYGPKKGKRIWEGKAPIRKGVNETQDQELRRIGDDIGAGIVREAAKK